MRLPYAFVHMHAHVHFVRPDAVSRRVDYDLLLLARSRAEKTRPPCTAHPVAVHVVAVVCGLLERPARSHSSSYPIGFR